MTQCILLQYLQHANTKSTSCNADRLVFTNSSWKTMGFSGVGTDLTMGEVNQYFLNGPGRMLGALQTTAAMEAPLIDDMCADPVPGRLCGITSFDL